MSERPTGVEYSIYHVRTFTFFDPEDPVSDGYWSYQYSSRNKDKALARMKLLAQQPDTYVEVTERRVTEQRVAQSHEELPDAF